MKFKSKVSSSKNLERLRQGGSNFGGRSKKGIKHGARGRNLEDTAFGKKRNNFDDGIGEA